MTTRTAPDPVPSGVFTRLEREGPKAKIAAKKKSEATG